MPKKTTTTPKPLSRTERRDLDIEIGFLEGVVRRDPEYVEALQILGDDYTARGRITEGLHVDEQLAVLRPDDSLVFYNLACSYSLSKEFAKAVESMHKALDLGYRDFGWLSRDEDLRELRKHPLFKPVRARILQLKKQKDSGK